MGEEHNMISRRSRRKHLLAFQFQVALAEAVKGDVGKWVSSGRLRYHERVFEDIENMPQAFIGLFTGVNTGKMIVSLDM